MPPSWVTCLKRRYVFVSINGELAAANSKAEALLGPVWSRGEPQLDHLIQVRTWGAALDERLAALAGDDADWMSRLRELIASLFKQGPAAYEVGTTIGNRLNHYRDTITKFDAAYEPLSESAALHRGPLDNAADHLSVIISTFSMFQQFAPRLRSHQQRTECGGCRRARLSRYNMGAR